MSRSHGLIVSLAPFAFEPIEQGSELLDLASQGEHARFFMAQSLFKFAQQTRDIAQLSFHRKRTFGTLFPSGYRHIVEALSGLREKERVGIFQRQLAAQFWIRHDVSITQLGQNDFERFAKAI